MRDPRSAAHDAQHAIAGPTRIAAIARAIRVGTIPVRHPLPDVASHVVEAQVVRRIAPDRLRATLALLRRLGEVVGVGGAIGVVAPGKSRAVTLTARRPLPLRLGRQADHAANPPAYPS